MYYRYSSIRTLTFWPLLRSFSPPCSAGSIRTVGVSFLLVVCRLLDGRPGYQYKNRFCQPALFDLYHSVPDRGGRFSCTAMTLPPREKWCPRSARWWPCLCLLRRQIRRSAKLPEADHLLFPAAVGEFRLLSFCCMAPLFAGRKIPTTSSIIRSPLPFLKMPSSIPYMYYLVSSFSCPPMGACHRHLPRWGRQSLRYGLLLFFLGMMVLLSSRLMLVIMVLNPGRQFFTPLFLPKNRAAFLIAGSLCLSPSVFSLFTTTQSAGVSARWPMGI